MSTCKAAAILRYHVSIRDVMVSKVSRVIVDIRRLQTLLIAPYRLEDHPSEGAAGRWEGTFCSIS